ncbi:hypothetical protein [Shigella boydii]|nr:hypothetical protein [Shigella boydii]EIQ29912.1 putative DNA methylase domain protein [Shigella boydii 965-58]
MDWQKCSGIKRSYLVQSLFLKKNHVSMKSHRWFAVVTRYYR